MLVVLGSGWTTIQHISVISLILFSWICSARLIPTSSVINWTITQSISHDDSSIIAKRTITMLKDWPAPPSYQVVQSWQYVLQHDTDPEFGDGNPTNFNRVAIQELAKEGYESCIEQRKDVVQVVAALWVPNEGVYLSSILRDNGSRDLINKEGDENGARRWRSVTSDATIQPPDRIWYHAEDGACWLYENLRTKPLAQGAVYPSSGNQRPYIAVYGVSAKGKAPGRLNPCGFYCKPTLDALGVAYDTVPKPVNA